MSGVTLLRMLDVLRGSVGLGAARRLRSCGADAETLPLNEPSARPAMPGSSSPRFVRSRRDVADCSTPARLSMPTEESKACSADLCRPESGATKEQQKAMARSITSHHSIYFFERRGRLFLAWPGVGLRLAARRSSPWNHAFSPTLTTSGQVTSSPLCSVRVSRLPISGLVARERAQGADNLTISPTSGWKASPTNFYFFIE